MISIIFNCIDLIGFIYYSENEISFLNVSFNEICVSVELLEMDTFDQYSCANMPKKNSPVIKLTKNVVSHTIQFNQSYKAMENVAKLINSTPGRKIAIPDTKHKIKKTVNGLFDTEFYIQCKSCDEFTGTTNIETKCSTKSCEKLINRVHSPYFVNFPLKIQLTKSINDNFERIISYDKYINEKSKMIRDIHDGLQYKKNQRTIPRIFYFITHCKYGWCLSV